MSLTGKTIDELPLLSSITGTTYIPVYYSATTFKTELKTIQPYKVWTALLTQTGPMSFSANTDTRLKGGLILYEIYTIENYVVGDDFSNIGQVIEGVMNTTGCVFIAVGSKNSPYLFATSWNGSTLTSQGDIITNVLENTLGYDITVEYPAYGDPIDYTGIARLYPSGTSFLKNKTTITANATRPYRPIIPPNPNIQYPYLVPYIDASDLNGTIFIFDFFTGQLSGELLFNTTVQIKVYN